MLAHDRLGVLQHIRQEFQSLGYVGNLLQENYAYADVLAPEYAVRQIPLAVFAQDPPSYRTASFGVVVANGRSGAEFIQGHRSLGAPQIIEIGDDQVSRWKVTGKGLPVHLDTVNVNKLPDYFAQHKEVWSPQQVLRAKSNGQMATQLDFLDLDLLPLLDYEVRVKLDRLLRDTVNLAIHTFKTNAPFTEEQYPPLFRLIFRLIASKVLADRNHPGDWAMDDPQSVIKAVEDFYFKDVAPEPVLEHYETQLAIWNRVKSTFHFQNLSVESLAYVYENTLVTPETRKSFGIHSTPPSIAEYIVRRLPFDRLEQNDRRVFEPFAGHSVFLVAAMQRMRELLPSHMTPEDRHEYFVEMLSAIEIDPFAREVARLSLMLADYPNPDGWNLHDADALESSVFDNELAKSNIVLCNPPFEAFNQDERARYEHLISVWKPAEILHRVLQNPPELLGFVLPQVFLRGQAYKELRSRLGATYESIELLALPDRVFQHSDAEAVLVLASGLNVSTTHMRTGGVYKWHHKDFYAIQPSYEFEYDVEDAEATFAHSMWRPAHQDVWDATSRMRRLDEFSSIHRGIEYNLPFRANESTLLAHEQRPGFVRGLHRVRGAVEPFMVGKTVFLNISPSFMRTNAHGLPWNKPKLIVNANQQSRGPWKITASLDDSGLVCYQTFHGLWPSDGLSLEVLAAVLNGPVANAYIGTREAKRHVHVQTLKDIPIPEFDQAQQDTIISLVRQYSDVRRLWLSAGIREDEAEEWCLRLLISIDAEVLQAYNLAPRIERELLDYFSGHARLGPVAFTQYFPSTFQPFIPWHLYLSQDFKLANARDTLRRLPVIPESPLVSETLSYIE